MRSRRCRPKSARTRSCCSRRIACRWRWRAAASTKRSSRRAAQLVGDALELERWRLVYQSNNASYGREPWLGPDIRDALREAKAEGVDAVVVAPIGFVCDHMEVIMDLDVDAAAVARELGLTMVRAATVGTHPAYVAMVRELIVERLTPEAPRRALGALGPSHDRCAGRLLLAGPAGAAEAGSLRRRRSRRCGRAECVGQHRLRCRRRRRRPRPACTPRDARSRRPPCARARGAAARRRAHSFDAPTRRHRRGRRHLHRRGLHPRHRRRRTPRRRAHGRDADTRVLPRAGSRARRRADPAGRVADASRQRFPGARPASRCRGTITASSRCATTRSRSPATGSIRGTRPSTSRHTIGCAAWA